MCDFDATQNFSANAIYELPSPAHGWMKTLAGGWQVGGIVTASTGAPFTLLQAGNMPRPQGTNLRGFPHAVPHCNPPTGNFTSKCLYPATPDCSGLLPPPTA